MKEFSNSYTWLLSIVSLPKKLKGNYFLCYEMVPRSTKPLLFSESLEYTSSVATKDTALSK